MSDHPVPAPARELTPEEWQARVERCFAIEQSVKAALHASHKALWGLAAQLHEFDEQSGWTALGYKKLTHWLADPEIGMTQGRYYDLIRTYRELARRQVEPAAMAELELSKVRRVLPAVKSGAADLDDALDDVQQLGWRDLREKYRGALKAQAQAEPAAEDSPPEVESWLPDTYRPDGEPDAELLAVPRADLAALHQRARAACEGSRRDRDRFVREASRELSALLGGDER